MFVSEEEECRKDVRSQVSRVVASLTIGRGAKKDPKDVAVLVDDPP
jgi:hypothetical protein